MRAQLRHPTDSAHDDGPRGAGGRRDGEFAARGLGGCCCGGAVPSAACLWVRERSDHLEGMVGDTPLKTKIIENYDFE